MKHRGEIVAKAVKNSGMKITDLALKMKKSRKWVYDMFADEAVSYDVIIAVGKIIRHDFSFEFPQLNPQKQLTKPELLNEKDNRYLANEQNPEYWKNKYLALLEDYNQLLREKTKKGK